MAGGNLPFHLRGTMSNCEQIENERVLDNGCGSSLTTRDRS